uniref:CDC23 (cell division cycle 23, yeast, homolog) n=1 Tax=Lepisosteus oculatus TaxID=7918 RepID=W5MTM3_LEPOC
MRCWDVAGSRVVERCVYGKMETLSCDFNDLVKIKKDLIAVVALCRERGLAHSVKWSFSSCRALCPWPRVPGFISIAVSSLQEDAQDLDTYALAKSYFDLKEYDRAAYFLRGCRSQKAYFLYMYSRYLSGEKKKDDETVDSLGEGTRRCASRCRVQLGWRGGPRLKAAGCVFILCPGAEGQETEQLLAVCLSCALGLIDGSRDRRRSSSWLCVYPVPWADRREQGQETEQLLAVCLSCGLGLIDRSRDRGQAVESQAQLGNQEVSDAAAPLLQFNELREQDPYRIENMDTFSNLLYVRSMKPELSYLAHNLCEIDKYRVETCCVIGNYYSLRSQHEKAALYFQRALKLNPRCLGAWTLMGHEYMEMKNTSAAIQAYRHAIEVNKRDYRAWYGLGQTYEILKMPFYCLYYYRRAHQLRPNDSRMLVALGECYEKLAQHVEAKKVLGRVFDQAVALFWGLRAGAPLHEQLNESDQAAQCYVIYIQDIFSCGEQLEHVELSTAFRYLGQYYFKNKRYDEASLCAQRCCDYNDAREDGKALLRQISQVRGQGEAASSDLPLPFVFGPLSNNNTP